MAIDELEVLLHELGIEVRVIPIKNIETDLVPITEHGKENIEAIVKWERMRNILMKVV